MKKPLGTTSLLNIAQLLKVIFVITSVLIILHFLISGFHSNYHEKVVDKISSKVSEILELIEIQPEYEKYIAELRLTDPGEYGVAVKLPSIVSNEVTAKIQEGYDRHGFNAFISNMISLNRKLNDTRADVCKNRRYNSDLPKCSIIIPFHNEEWTLLLRTVHALVNRAPDHLIEEIILVDDASDRGRKSFLN